MIIKKQLTQTLNSLLRVKAYFASIVITIGLTLGAMATLFVVNYQLISAPLAFDPANSLYITKGVSYLNGEQRFVDKAAYPALIEAYKNGDPSFERRALVNFNRDIVRNIASSPNVEVSYVTPEYMEMIDVPVVVGRTFTNEEGLGSLEPIAVISYSMWQALFGGRSDILGQSITLGQSSFKIIGVTAQDFNEPELMFVGRKTDIWLPWDFNQTGERWRVSWGGKLGNHYLTIKLKSGVSPAPVANKLTNTLNTRFKEETAGRSFFKDATIAFELVSFKDKIVGDSYQQTLLLFIGTFLLMLIALTNITNLIIARMSNKVRSFAINAALGASNRDVFKLILAEMLLLMITAVLFSFVISFFAIDTIKALDLKWLPRANELSFNWLTGLFSIVVGLLIAVMTTFIVNSRINYSSLSSVILTSGKGTALQVSGTIRRILITGQIAIATVLLVVCFQVLIKTATFTNQEVGFSSKDILHLSVDMGQLRDASGGVQATSLLGLRDKLIESPKVKSVSLAQGNPLIPKQQFLSFFSSDADFVNQKNSVVTLIDENYLNLLNVNFLSGRNVTANDFNQPNRVIVVNEAFKNSFSHNEDILNKQYYWLNSPVKEPYQVIGLVEDFNLPGQLETPRAFLPYLAFTYPEYFIQLHENQSFSKAELNILMKDITAEFKVGKLQSFEDARKSLTWNYLLLGAVTTILSIVTLSLAAIGIFGVTSYSIALRRSEIGIKMAIGASAKAMISEIIKDSFRWVAIGFLISAPLLYAIHSWLTANFYGFQIDILVALGTVLLISGIVFIANVLAISKAVNTPIIHALRDA